MKLSALWLSAIALCFVLNGVGTNIYAAEPPELEELRLEVGILKQELQQVLGDEVSMQTKQSYIELLLKLRARINSATQDEPIAESTTEPTIAARFILASVTPSSEIQSAIRKSGKHISGELGYVYGPFSRRSISGSDITFVQVVDAPSEWLIGRNYRFKVTIENRRDRQNERCYEAPPDGKVRMRSPTLWSGLSAPVGWEPYLQVPQLAERYQSNANFYAPSCGESGATKYIPCSKEMERKIYENWDSGPMFSGICDKEVDGISYRLYNTQPKIDYTVFTKDNLTIDVIFDRVVTHYDGNNNDLKYYIYTLQASSTRFPPSPKSQEIALYYTNEGKPRSTRIEVTLAGLDLHYQLDMEGDAPTWVPANVPAEISAPPLPGKVVYTRPAPELGDINSDQAEGEGAGSIAIQAQAEPENSQRTTQSADGETAVVSRPDHPNIIALINEWVARAEPPQNATEGGNFRYNQWGQLTGTSASGGRATPNGPPDVANGRTPVEHMWSTRHEADSVDHCTLGNYIDLKLADQPISQCTGRYQPVVPNLVGKAVAAAKSTLNSRNLTVNINVGKPAPTASLAGSIERQGVAGQTQLPKGSVVELWVHTAYLGDLVLLNSWVGKPIAEAKKALEDNGVKVAIEIGTPAKSEAASNTVEEQIPQGAMRVKRGSKVTLLMHTQFVDQVVLKSMRGMPIAEAKAKLIQQGLQVSISISGPAKSRNRSETVESQSPVAGLKVARGSNVTLKVYSRYVDMVLIPRVVGLTYQEASTSLQGAGFRMPVESVNNSANSIVTSQTPAAGIKALRGTTVSIDVRAASGEGGTTDDASASASGQIASIRPQPTSLRCFVQFPDLPLDTAPSYTENGRVDQREESNSYHCWHRWNNKSFLVSVRWYHTTPTPSSARFMKDYCTPRSELPHWHGVGKYGKAVAVSMATQLAKSLGESRKQQIIDYHLNQIIKYAIPCSSTSLDQRGSDANTSRQVTELPKGSYVSESITGSGSRESNIPLVFGCMSATQCNGNYYNGRNQLYGRYDSRTRVYSGYWRGNFFPACTRARTFGRETIRHYGQVELHFDQGLNSFTGTWNYCDNERPGGKWNGQKK